jgi:EpsI family protein
LTAASKSAPPPPREKLAALPFEMDGWNGVAGPPLEARVLQVLGADDYISRIYSRANSNAVGLYVGYHASQHQGASIHSPMNCLPGAGWIPVDSSRIAIPDRRTPGAQVTINRIVVAKGDERQLVLYWYQSQGRVVASEYAGKAYLFLDAIRSGRTDAALVRLITPVDSQRGSQAAESLLQGFATDLLPILNRFLPD